jgi:uncharacterized protein YoxC
MAEHMYGNLGRDMKTMKRERAKGRDAIRSVTSRIRDETAGFLSGVCGLLADIGKANAVRGPETREMLKAMASETAAEAARLAEAIRKSVADLKAEAHQITADANRFMADTSAANTRLRDRTRGALSAAQAERKTQSRQGTAERKSQWRQGSAETQRLVAGIRKDVAGLKAQTGQILAEAAAMLGRFTSISQRRASEWQDIVQGMQDGGQPVTAGPAVAVAARPAVAVTAGPAVAVAARPAVAVTATTKGAGDKARRRRGGRRSHAGKA